MEDSHIPEALDRRDVENEFLRLNQRWSEFRRFLQNAPVAVRRRFVRDVVVRDSLLQPDAVEALLPKSPTAGEQDRTR
jgi:hypothetical protein